MSLSISQTTLEKTASTDSISSENVFVFPASFSQQRLWLLDQIEGESATYNMSMVMLLTGSLNIPVLEQALSEIVARHEALRTNFQMVDDAPVQVIAETTDFQLQILEVPLSGEPLPLSPDIEQLIFEETQHPFDLAKDALFRVKLLRLNAEHHVLLVTMHHIISDAWSMGVFRRELTELYEAFSLGKPSPLTPLPIQYADFAHWQQELLSGERLDSHLGYWRQQLVGIPPLLELPTDRPRPSIQKFRGSTERFQLTPALTQKLKVLSQQSKSTLFMTLLAAFTVLLSRYSGFEDIVVGSPIANRQRSELESLIGCFVNTLVLRTKLTENPTFVEVLDQVRQTALDAYTHQDLPFEKLVEELQPERSLSHSSLFQVMFILQNAPRGPQELPGLKMTPLKRGKAVAKFDLSLSMAEVKADNLHSPDEKTVGEAQPSTALIGGLEYNSDLFDAATIARMAQHFQTLLEGIVTAPEQRISDLPLLSPQERHQILVEWNETESEYPSAQCIHQLFEEQVEQTPDAIALVFEDQQLTYGELNARANQLAHYLRSLGVKPEVLVGICIERSLEMVVGLLGILKAGGAYVPLDPAYPIERLGLMIEETQLKVLLTQQSLIEKFPSHPAQVVGLDKDSEAINLESKTNLSNSVTLDNLAYVMYTSGSTGRPKGVSVIHRGVVRLVKETNYVNLTAEEVFLQLAPVSFDASTFEIWGSLLNGARLIIFSGQTPSPEELGVAIRKHRVTTLWLTAALFHLMVDERLEDLRPLRQLLAGGDVLSVPHVQKVLGELDCQLLNGYGPTENTTFTCCYRVTRDKQIETTVPIGKPIANTQVYVLDQHLQPVPIGVEGELYIGGDGLARGYFQRPELTQEKFIPNPFNKSKVKSQKSKVYKTGDLARYLPDGNIEFLGRIDNQVKIRGFRIELGEIEAVLAQHPTVQETTVTAREDIPGDKRLVAYVVPNPEQATTVSELRSFLKQKLPDYMVPSAFVLLDALPLNPNGKVDRRALPAPDQVRQEPEETFVAPRDELELQLTKIWEKVLVTQPVGVRDNFFDLGGSSLLAVRLFAQIEKKFGKDLPLATLFQSPTIEQLASLLRQSGWSPSWSSLVTIQPSGSRPPFFFHGGAADGICWAKFARHLAPDQPFYALQRPDLNSKQATQTTVEDLAAHCIKEIRTVQPEGPYLLGGQCFGGTVAFEMAHQLHRQGEKVALLALVDAYAPKLVPPKSKPNSLSFRCQKLFHRVHRVGFWLRQRYRYHLGQLALRGPLGKLTYFPKRVLEKAKSRLKGDYLPRHRRYLLAEKRSRDARMSYVPQRYPGRVTLFRASKQLARYWDYGPQLGWDELAGGGIESHEIPGVFGTLLGKQSSAPLLAEKLRACLDQTQAEEHFLEDKNLYNTIHTCT